MPHKFNAERRHHIMKMPFEVTNWFEYEAGLRRRGSLTMWIAEETIDAWTRHRARRRAGKPATPMARSRLA